MVPFGSLTIEGFRGGKFAVLFPKTPPNAFFLQKTSTRASIPIHPLQSEFSIKLLHSYVVQHKFTHPKNIKHGADTLTVVQIWGSWNMRESNS